MMKIGLALGSGSSRGWAHIGVINALADLGIVPDIVCGTSIGSLVGASYVSNNLPQLETWVRSLSKFETAKFFEINRSFNGFVNTERLHRFFDQYVANKNSTIEGLTKQYAAVATDLESGREVWLTQGAVLAAVRASISLPGLFPAVNNNNRWLVDGGLVNPVPISTCRALGADIVIAVNLNGGLVGKSPKQQVAEIKDKEDSNDSVVDKFTDLVTDYTSSLFSSERQAHQAPSLFDAIAGSVNITQDRITRSRMAGDPPDILLSPKLSDIGLLEFYRASEAIEEGRQCVQRKLSEIEYVLGLA
jgi:NTE family protein